MRYPRAGDTVRWILDVGTMFYECEGTWKHDYAADEFTPHKYGERTNHAETVDKIHIVNDPPGKRLRAPGGCWDPRQLGKWFVVVEKENEFGPVSP